MNEKTYAFIDSQNLNLGILELGWKLDFSRFRVYLTEKYRVKKAFLFIGYLEGNSELYRHLQEDGYILIFKPTLTQKDGSTKGNVDAELVLHTMIQLKNFEKAVIVTGDGDFHCLVQHLIKLKKLGKILVPNKAKYSTLLRRFDSQYLAFVSDLEKTLQYKPYKRKEPRKDKTLKGAFHRDSRKIVPKKVSKVKR